MPAKLKNGVKGARGGTRKGAGRKKSFATKLKERKLESENKEAGKSLDFVIRLRDNKDAPLELRNDAAKEVMDRIWGKSKTRSEFSGPDGGAIETRNPIVDRLLEKMKPEDVMKLALAHVGGQ